MLKAETLHGSWKLNSFEQTLDGTLIRGLPESSGLLIYSPEGYVSVAMRRIPDSKDPAILSAWGYDLFYAGTYEIEQPSTVIHQVQLTTLPQFLNRPLRRTVRLLDENRTLELSMISVDGKSPAKVIWRRL